LDTGDCSPYDRSQLGAASSRLHARRPRELDAYERAFGIAPRFAAPDNTFDLPRAALALPQRTADALLGKLVERHAHGLALELPTGVGLAARVRTLLARSFAHGACDSATLAGAAAALNLPPRTLQRRLAAEGASFAGLLDEVRRELSLRLLADPVTSIAEVAFALGFGDQPAFHRAFSRWQGSTPGEYRRRLLAPEATRIDVSGQAGARAPV